MVPPPSVDGSPDSLLTTEDPIFEFNKAIIDATNEYCVAYKPNTAFYEVYGVKGWQALEKTINYIFFIITKNVFLNQYEEKK